MPPISFIFIHPTIPHPNTGQYSPLRISHQGQESILLLLRHPSYSTRNCVVTTVHRRCLKALVEKMIHPTGHHGVWKQSHLTEDSTNEPRFMCGRREIGGFHTVSERMQGEQKARTY